MGRPYIERAHRRGLDVALLDSQAALSWPETQSVLLRQDRTYEVDGTEDRNWLSAASHALADGPVVGVVGFSEPQIVSAAIIADELGLPGPGVRAAVTSRNKVLQRESYRRAGLHQPEFLCASDVAEAVQWSKERFPVVIKPLAGSGSSGVYVANNSAELESAVGSRSDSAFLIERFVAGPEFSVEALVTDGQVIFQNVTAKTTSELPYRVEIEHRLPATISSNVGGVITELTQATVAALGVGTGIVHMELILDNGRPAIVETAVRTPGDYLFDAILGASEVDLYDAVVAVVCGEFPDLAVKDSSDGPGFADIWFPTARGGKLLGVDGIERVSALEGTIKIEIDVEPGHQISELRSSMDRLGVVISAASDIELLESQTQEAKRVLRFTVD